MGVPAFFRWISEKYPKILTRCLEESGNVDASKPNPNNYEFDNFYLDMNGLIHPCTHPEGEEAPATEEEMYQVIFRYLDRLFNMIRPRKVIYMAIDGVAPRAKMNQQRSRRFRSAAEAAEADEDADRIRKEMIGMGLKPPPKKKPTWDSNVITPGTEFMAKLSEWVRYYIAERLNTNPAFRNVRVILSDAQSPGEGEHKIMQFIRRERAEPGYDPNTTHVLYGLDADLIMLGLASHEVHFTILREEVLFGKAKKQRQDTEGYKVDSVLLNNNSAGGQDPQLELAMADAGMIGKPKKPFDLVRLWILREYLIFEFRPETFYQPLTFEYNFEACIDDFVFICFFVGNDFLPHLPSLSIREGGLELLLDLYKRVLPTVRGYLTTDGKVNLDRVDVYMAVLGTVEDEIFLRRRQQELYDKQRRENMNKTKKLGGKLRALGAAAIDKAEAVVSTRKRKTRDNDTPVTQPVAKKPAPGKDENKSAAAALRAKLKGTNLESSSQQQDRQQQDEGKGKEKDEDDNEKEAEFGDDDDEEDEVLAEIEDEPSDPYEHIDVTNYVSCDSKEALEEFEKRAKEKEHARNVHEDVKDEVRLGESGWKDRYYVSKFGEAYRDPNSPERKRIVKEYVTGLCWVMEYYYKGCQSWTWFYPYHYAPFASDMVNIDKINIEFPPSMPFKPIEQLMGVFPPASAHALPEPCRWYMTSIDSPIADFYPTKFEYDPNGKAVRWLWIALLPFIDEKRLLKVSAEIEKEFTAAEKARNSFNPDLIFSRVDAPGTDQMIKAASDFQKRQEARAKLTKNKTLESEKVELTSTPTTAGDVRQGQKDCGRLLLSTDTHGVSGYFMPPPPEFEFVANEEITPPSRKLEPIQNNKVVCFEFRLPKMKPHLCRLIQGVSIPPPCLSMADLHTRAPRLSRGAQVGNLLIERHGPHPSIIRGPPVPFGAFPHQQHQQQFPGATMMQPQMPPNMGYHQQQRHQQPYAHGTNQPRPKHFRGNYDQDYSQRQQQYQQPHHSRGGYGAGNRYDRGGGYGGHRNDGGRGGGYGNRYDGGRGGRYDDRRSNASQQGHHQHQGQYSRQDSRDHRGGQGYGQHRGGQSSHHFQNNPPPQHHAPPQHAQQAAPRPPPPPPPNFGGGSASNSGGYSNRSALMDSLSAALKNRKR